MTPGGYRDIYAADGSQCPSGEFILFGILTEHRRICRQRSRLVAATLQRTLLRSSEAFEQVEPGAIARYYGFANDT